MRVWTAVFTLHSGHVEDVSHARYIVSHQSRNLGRMYILPLTKINVIELRPIGFD